MHASSGDNATRRKSRKRNVEEPLEEKAQLAVGRARQAQETALRGSFPDRFASKRQAGIRVLSASSCPRRRSGVSPAPAGQLLHVDRKNNFIHHARSAERWQLSRAETQGNCRASKAGRSAESGSTNPISLRPMPRLSWISARHLAGPRPATDNQQVVIATEAITHPGDAGVRDRTPHQKQHEIDFRQSTERSCG